MRQGALLYAAAHAGGITDVVPRLHRTARSLAHESVQPNPIVPRIRDAAAYLGLLPIFLTVCTNIEVKA